jgi:hypothetical protein
MQKSETVFKLLFAKRIYQPIFYNDENRNAGTGI